MNVLPGDPFPLGATWTGSGVNFSLYARNAQGVELCLFHKPKGEKEYERIKLTERSYNIWHCYVEGLKPGTLYAYRVQGPYNPGDGYRFNPNKVLLDPYAKAICGVVEWDDSLFGYKMGEDDLSFSEADDAELAPKAAVIDPSYDWEDDKPPKIAYHNSIIYEAHIKSLTWLMPGIPEGIRGTYAALAHEATIGHLKRLGITTIELMPVHECVSEKYLIDKGLTNYWGYNTIGFFSPDFRYYKGEDLGGQVREFKDAVLKLIMDSLRYWVVEMHVDGFRFDLAATLARELHDVNMLGAFFTIIYQDPVLSMVKLIAEPWDVGEGGYQIGQFPAGWAEWNGKYRDHMRNFWRGKECSLADFADRFTGSPDLYNNDNRNPSASINFITAHDGFNLSDLVSYEQKHNEANGNNNEDGNKDNNSWNCGAEGPTDDRGIETLRWRQKLNFLTTLLLSQGVPMILCGDEAGHTKKGNNNTYCQDNELEWIDWSKADQELIDLTSRLITFRKKHPAFSRKHWFMGKSIKKRGLADIAWFEPNGNELEDGEWKTGFAKSLGLYLNGDAIGAVDETNQPIVDDSFYILFNASEQPVEFHMPPENFAKTWQKLWDTADVATCITTIDEQSDKHGPGATITVPDHSVVVLISVRS